MDKTREKLMTDYNYYDKQYKLSLKTLDTDLQSKYKRKREEAEYKLNKYDNEQQQKVQQSTQPNNKSNNTQSKQQNSNTQTKQQNNAQNANDKNTQQNKQSNSQQQDKQYSSDVNRNWYIDYYGNDIHKNGATPFNAGNKPEDEENDDDQPKEKPEEKGRRFEFSNDFYPDYFHRIGNFGRGNELDIQADKAKAMSQNAQYEAATHGMESQEHTRIANLNPMDTAQIKAGMKSHLQNKANAEQNSAKGNDQVGFIRMNNPADVNYEQQRGDTERRFGEEQRQKELNSQATADMMANDEKQLRHKSGDYNSDLYNSWKLSRGIGSSLEDQPKEEPETQVQPEPEQEPQQGPQAEPEPQEPINGNPHHVFNYVTFGNKTNSQNYNMQGMDENDRKLWEAWGKPQPLTADEVKNVPGGLNGDLGQLQQVVRQVRPDFYNKYNEASGRNLDTAKQNNSMSQEQLNSMNAEVPAYACGTDNAKAGYALVGENGPEIVEMKGGEKVIPITKYNVDMVLSDMRFKMISEMLKNGHGMNEDDFLFLVKNQGGKFNHNGRDYDFFNDDDWKDDKDDSVLNAYADHIKNFVYTYIDDAKKIDPSIDTTEEHIGPMAQDIEKVNPACVKETPEGVKTVDTSRLSMMNAGAIGDLAREMSEIKQLLREVLNGR